MSRSINFSGFTSSWKNMHYFFVQVEKIPTDLSSFVGRYGEFANTQELQAFIDACTDISRLAASLGNSTSLKEVIAQNPSYLSSNTSPDEIYARIVWLAGLAGNAAQTISHTYNELQAMLSPSEGTVEQRAENLKNALVGDSGLVPVIVKVKSESVELDRKFSPLQKKLAATFSDFGKTNLLNQANQEIGALEASITNLKAKCEEAKKAWKNAWINKEKDKNKYEELSQQLTEKEASLTLKTRFVGDLDGFFVSGNKMVQASMDIANNINTIGSVFGELRDSYMNICRISSAEQLSDYEWVANALGLPASTKPWNATQQNAKHYVEQSMISL